MEDTVQIQLGLQSKTVELIKSLTNKTNAETPADTISSSVQLASELIEEIMKGSKIIIENNDGTKQQLSIKGINS